MERKKALKTRKHTSTSSKARDETTKKPFSLSDFITKKNDWLFWLYGVGLLGHLLPATRDSMIALTPLTLFGTLLAILIYMKKDLSWKVIGWLLGIYIITLITEIIGVAKGTIFGPYVYGQVLGLAIFDTPLIIGALWVFVIMGCLQLLQEFTDNKYLLVLGTTVGVVVFDYILEPVAIAFEYWTWLTTGIPIKNYITWGILGCIGAIAYVLLNIKVKNKLPRDLFIIMTLFFVILRVFVA